MSTLQLYFFLSLCCVLAYLDQKKVVIKIGEYIKPKKLFFTVLIVFMALPIGLRRRYNDTTTYIGVFENAPSIMEFLAEPENLDILKNPLFYAFTSLMRTVTDNYHIYFMVCAVFVSISMLTFFHAMSEATDFSLCIFTYVTLGTYFFACAAMKQTIAMAILTYAVRALIKKKHIAFCGIVLLAGLFHTYAWFYFILLLLVCRPWKLRTFFVVIATIFVMRFFDSAISAYLEYADTIGKGALEELVFSGDSMNILRVTVYSLVPVVSLICKPYLEQHMKQKHCVLLHMSILSFMFMLLASVDGANMFGRMARYFEMGTICMFPWIIHNTFDEKSRLIGKIGFVCGFLGFFFYGYMGFEHEYRAISIFDFVSSLL